MPAELAQVLWRQSLQVYLRSSRIHDDAARRLMRLGDLDSAMLAAELASASRHARADALARHPDWAP